MIEKLIARARASSTTLAIGPGLLYNSLILLISWFRAAAAAVADMAAQDLSLPMDWALLRRLTAEGRLHVMGCPGDTWLSLEQYEEMHDRVPGLQVSEPRALLQGLDGGLDAGGRKGLAGVNA